MFVRVVYFVIVLTSNESRLKLDYQILLANTILISPILSLSVIYRQQIGSCFLLVETKVMAAIYLN